MGWAGVNWYGNAPEDVSVLFYASYISTSNSIEGQSNETLCYIFVTFLGQLSFAASTLSHIRKSL